MNYPNELKIGDKVSIVAPAGKLVKGTLENALKTLEGWGLQVTLGQFINKGHHYFSGTDRERLIDLQNALDNPEIKAIFCARGGYGITRIIDSVNFEGFKSSSKWIIGFSDITALHFHAHKMEIASVHSVMPTGFGDAETESIESLRKILFGGDLHYEFESNQLNRNGSASAQIIGGNLSLIMDSIGTSSNIDFDNKILFIEEIDEYFYKIDRMLVQLKRAGKLSKLAGLIVGHMTEMKDTKVPFGKTVNELIAEHVSEFSYPIAYTVPVGHEPLNIAIPCSYACNMNITDNSVQLKFNK